MDAWERFIQSRALLGYPGVHIDQYQPSNIFRKVIISVASKQARFDG